MYPFSSLPAWALRLRNYKCHVFLIVGDDGPDAEAVFDEQARVAMGIKLSNVEHELLRVPGK
jgi:hypothetical protein